MKKYDSPELQRQIEDLLKDLMRLNKKATERLDGTAARRKIAQLIDSLIKCTRDDILPQTNKSSLKLYSEGRASRSFDAELNRLWDKTTVEYQRMFADQNISNLPAIISEQIFSEDPDFARRGFEHLAAVELNSAIIPELESRDTPGDDILLYSLHILINPDEKIITNHIAESLITPPQMLYAFLGIFGLLIQARRSEDRGNLPEAYSYIIDANHMIGMLEASTWITRRFDTISASRNGKLRGKKETKKKIAVQQAKWYVEQLFNSLMPIDNMGLRKWRSAEAALEAINIYICDHKIDIGISDETIKKECAKLNRAHKKKKETNKFNLQVNYAFTKKDGSKIYIPIPLDE